MNPLILIAVASLVGAVVNEVFFKEGKKNENDVNQLRGVVSSSSDVDEVPSNPKSNGGSVKDDEVNSNDGIGNGSGDVRGEHDAPGA